MVTMSSKVAPTQQRWPPLVQRITLPDRPNAIPTDLEKGQPDVSQSHWILREPWSLKNTWHLSLPSIAEDVGSYSRVAPKK
jgi:hypothetical protein